jgi:hypothetical protein
MTNSAFVVKNVEYEQVPYSGGPIVFNRAQDLRLLTPITDSKADPDTTMYATRVFPHTYYMSMRVPSETPDALRGAIEYLQKRMGAAVETVKEEDHTLVTAHITIGVLEDVDDRNLVLSLLDGLQAMAEYKDVEVKLAKKDRDAALLDAESAESKLAGVMKHYDRCLDRILIAKRASFWRRLRWLFTGVKI